MLDTFAQIQEIRTYYDFHAVDDDRYIIDGKLRQTDAFAARTVHGEPAEPHLDQRALHVHHGYGLTLGTVNEATKEGLPVLLVQDIPPVSRTASINITRPSIYYGQLSNDYAFVGTRPLEFYHPTGDGSVETAYTGQGGVRLNSMFPRLAVAWLLTARSNRVDDRLDFFGALDDRAQQLDRREGPGFERRDGFARAQAGKFGRHRGRRICNPMRMAIQLKTEIPGPRSREIMDAAHPGGLGGTYAGNPLACVAALETLDTISSPAFLARAREVGGRIRARLEKIQSEHGDIIGDVRGLGPMLAMEVVTDRESRKPSMEATAAINAATLERGVITIRAGLYSNCVRFLPPLNIDDGEIDEAMDVVAEAVRAVAS